MGQILQMLSDVDAAMGSIIREHGGWIYPLIFLVAFTQTGFLLGPILPGSTVIFICGVFSRTEPGTVTVPGLLSVGILGGWLGCLTHYGLGKWAGSKVFSKDKGLLSKENLKKTESFFEKHGQKTMLLAPSVPFMRTFSSIVAGAAEMPLRAFGIVAAGGVTFWVGSMSAAGYVAGLVPGAKAGVLGLVALLSAAMIGRLAWQAYQGRQQSASGPELNP